MRDAVKQDRAEDLIQEHFENVTRGGILLEYHIDVVGPARAAHGGFRRLDVPVVLRRGRGCRLVLWLGEMYLLRRHGARSFDHCCGAQSFSSQSEVYSSHCGASRHGSACKKRMERSMWSRRQSGSDRYAILRALHRQVPKGAGMCDAVRYTHIKTAKVGSATRGREGPACRYGGGKPGGTLCG